MSPDPRVRHDGRCAQCGGHRLNRLPKVATKRSRAELIENLLADAFCSARCCRAWHGIDVGEDGRATAKDEDHEWAVGA